MSLPPSFGTQIAAIMDVLAKAAVAEITKLVDEGTVVFQLEMCRRDSEIEELKRSLQVMEIELCKAQEAVAEAAVTARISDDTHEHAVIGRHVVVHNADQEDPETCAMYMESKSVGSLFETGPHAEERRDLGPLVKSEPVDKLATQETVVQTGITNNVDSEIEKRDGPIWPSCHSMCEDASLEPEHAIQQCLQIFSSRAIEYPAQSDAVSSCDPLSTAGKVVGNAFSAAIKLEPQMQPVCIEGTASEPVRYVLHPTVNADHGLQPRLQQAGPSQMQRVRENMLGSNAAHAEDHILNRNRLKAKRPVNVWRAGINQKLFTCSVCGKGFPRFSQLEVHQFSHGAVKPFRCLECGKSFTQKTRLKTHQSVHTGERPFSCKICGKMFSRQDNCLRHERFHSGLKPYSCQQCGKSFTVLGNLKIHQEIHLRGR